MPISLSPPRIATILLMLGKGMTTREILTVFPELNPHDIRAALLEAADLTRDPDASLRPKDQRSLADLVDSARRNSGLDPDEAMALAVRETRAVRRAQRRQPRD